MKFRTKFTSNERAEAMASVDQYIRGQTKESPLLLETVSQSDLDGLEKASRVELLKTPANAFQVQPWLYYAALARDSKYARFRRTRLKSSALNSLYMENYGVAKIAHDSAHTDA